MSFTTEGQFVPFPAPILITITGAGTIAHEGLADTDAPARAIWTAGRRVWCKGTVTGQTVDGNNVWLVTGKGESRDLSWRIWSGATDFETSAVVGRKDAR